MPTAVTTARSGVRSDFGNACNANGANNANDQSVAKLKRQLAILGYVARGRYSTQVLWLQNKLKSLRTPLPASGTPAIAATKSSIAPPHNDDQLPNDLSIAPPSNGDQLANESSIAPPPNGVRGLSERRVSRLSTRLGRNPTVAEVAVEVERVFKNRARKKAKKAIKKAMKKGKND
jgi:hypothetical protein